jgi:hypothetical protein
MKFVSAAALAAIATIGFAAVTAAEAASGKGSKARSNGGGEARRIYDDRDRTGWYPRDSNQLRFGSAIWWEQMEREGRFGNRRTGR